METLGNKIADKSSTEYYCNLCDYKTCHKGHYNEHLSSLRHNRRKQNGTVGNKIVDNNLEIDNICCKNCNKKFKTRSGLWKHNKICNIENTSTKDQITDKELIQQILKQNSDLIKQNSELRKEQTDIKEIILEIVKNGTMNNSHNTTTTTTNSHNKAFNLNFFLNETCKNAMNITDFVETIKLQLSDLEKFGEIGYVEGLSNIIVKNLNDLDETLRPIHCTDKKRETMYIKDAGEWEKEDDQKTKLRKAIKTIANKNIRLLPKFREKYPDYSNSSSKISDKYDKMVIEAMVSDVEKEDKIIHNISKVTTISMK